MRDFEFVLTLAGGFASPEQEARQALVESMAGRTDATLPSRLPRAPVTSRDAPAARPQPAAEQRRA